MADYGSIAEAVDTSEDWGLVTEAAITEVDWGLIEPDEAESTPTLTAVADAIVGRLNGRAWSQSFTAVRMALPEFGLTDLGTLRVVVATRGQEFERLTRGKNITVVEIDIGVLRKLDGTLNAAVDPYVALVDEIARYFFSNPLPGFTATLPTVSKPDPVYDQDHLEKRRAFFAVIRLRIKVFP